MTKTIRVFLVDDHELVRRGLWDFLADESDFEVVGEAGNAADALTGVAATEPDVAVLDVRLPDGSGIEVCREISSQHPDVACLMLTSFSDEQAFLDAVLAGAAGYVLKETKTVDLLDAIRVLAAGGSLMDDEMKQELLTNVGGAAPPGVARLSPQERRILDLIAAGLSNREISERLHLAEQTVKNYVSRVLAKLGVARRTQAAVLGTRASGAGTSH